MGMDIYGKSGNYFRSNIWGWSDIIAATEAAIGKPVPDSWHYNDGAGINGLGMSTIELAQAIEDMFFPEGEPADPNVCLPIQADPTALKGTASMRDQIVAMLTDTDPDIKIVTPGADTGPCAGHVWDWCVFLRECGGDFEIN